VGRWVKHAHAHVQRSLRGRLRGAEGGMSSPPHRSNSKHPSQLAAAKDAHTRASRQRARPADGGERDVPGSDRAAKSSPDGGLRSLRARLAAAPRALLQLAARAPGSRERGGAPRAGSALHFSRERGGGRRASALVAPESSSQTSTGSEIFTMSRNGHRANGWTEVRVAQLIVRSIRTCRPRAARARASRTSLAISILAAAPRAMLSSRRHHAAIAGTLLAASARTSTRQPD
jgi:hypothetical protein